MNSNVALIDLLKCFEKYYTICEEPSFPFSATAVFKSHNEQYFLVKNAKIADIDSSDFVFFYDCHEDGKKELSAKLLEDLCKTAWQKGLENVKPYYGHRNSDVTLVIVAEGIAKDLVKRVKKINYYKSYKFGFFGWSAFRLALVESESGKVYVNHRGSDLKKLTGN